MVGMFSFLRLLSSSNWPALMLSLLTEVTSVVWVTLPFSKRTDFTGSPRVLSSGVGQGTEQQLRNVVGTWQLAQIRAAR